MKAEKRPMKAQKRTTEKGTTANPRKNRTTVPETEREVKSMEPGLGQAKQTLVVTPRSSKIVSKMLGISHMEKFQPEPPW
jgi:hypothetical protein